MLDPNTRHTYLRELQPPLGYELDFALATTFSLDLLTLLMAPLSMVFHETAAGEETLKDPIALLEALRRSTGKFAVFCQEDRISVPAQDRVLFRHLERAVIPVRAPYGGVFHPKVWVLRFTSPDGDSTRYRLLCLSRNLTFDRSWDTVLALDGTVFKHRQNGFSYTKPLVEFIKTLPGLAINPEQAAPYAQKLALLIDEVKRTQFQAPDDFYTDKITFEPSGIPGYKRVPPLAPASRRLVVSPFLSEEQLRPLAEEGFNHVLISRRESLDAFRLDLLKQIASRSHIYVMEDDLEGEETDQTLSGLHAKLYISEHARIATVRTGSVNATGAAWSGQNVEFAVSLQGGYSRVGIEPFLGDEQAKQSLRKLLVPYRIPDAPAAADAAQQHLEQMLQTARSALAGAGLRATVMGSGAEGAYDLQLSAERPLQLPNGASVRCYPISLQSAVAQPLAVPLRFQRLSLIALTGFFAFELTATQGTKRRTEAFVLNLPVTGMPEGREERIIQHLISDRARFLRYLLFLLAEGEQGEALQQAAMLTGETHPGDNAEVLAELPLLEELVRAYSRQPEKIRRIDQLVRGLRSTPEGRQVLPEGFDQLWGAFEAAMKEDLPA